MRLSGLPSTLETLKDSFLESDCEVAKCICTRLPKTGQRLESRTSTPAPNRSAAMQDWLLRRINHSPRFMQSPSSNYLLRWRHRGPWSHLSPVNSILSKNAEYYLVRPLHGPLALNSMIGKLKTRRKATAHLGKRRRFGENSPLRKCLPPLKELVLTF